MVASLILATVLCGSEPLPPISLSDLDVFPEGAVMTGASSASDRWWRYAESQRRSGESPWLDWGYWEPQAGYTKMAWDNLQTARQYSGFLRYAEAGSEWEQSCRDEAIVNLAELRRQIGPQAYYAGVMPAPCYDLPIPR